MKVFTQNLSPDLTAAGATYGRIDRGERTTEGLTILLNEFLALDPTLAFMHDPQIVVQTRNATHAIRTDRGRLHLYNAHDSSQPGVEMDLPTLLATIDESASATTAPDAVEADPLPVGRRPWKYEGSLAVILLLAGLGLNAWGAYQFIRREPPAPERAYTIITDKANRALLLQKLAGRFVTGIEPGNRVITLARDGTIQFGVLLRRDGGAVQAANGAAEPCHFGRRSNGSICIVTTRSGQVGISRDGSLVHYGDIYRRIGGLAD